MGQRFDKSRPTLNQPGNKAIRRVKGGWFPHDRPLIGGDSPTNSLIGQTWPVMHSNSRPDLAIKVSEGNHHVLLFLAKYLNYTQRNAKYLKPINWSGRFSQSVRMGVSSSKEKRWSQLLGGNHLRPLHSTLFCFGTPWAWAFNTQKK